MKKNASPLSICKKCGAYRGRHPSQSGSSGALCRGDSPEDENCTLADSGRSSPIQGAKTGRSPKDKRVVRHPSSEQDVWWGNVNIPIDDEGFLVNLERKDYLNTRKKLYVVDAFARAGIRRFEAQDSRDLHAAISRLVYAYHAHSAHTGGTGAFWRARCGDLQRRAFSANSRTHGMTSKTSVDLSLETRELVILGTEYAGEIKAFRRANRLFLGLWAGHPLDALLGHR